MFTKDGNLHRFAGFKDAEKEKLAKFFKHTYDLDMLDKEFSVKGHNWGTVEFEGGVMNIEIGKAVGFEVPLPYVNQCVSGKNEATLEFHLVNILIRTYCTIISFSACFAVFSK